MADDRDPGRGDDGFPGGRDDFGNRPGPAGATGGERASDLPKEATGNAGRSAARWSRTEAPEPTTEAAYSARSGATSVERPHQGFNPAWLLVPAAGLLLGGLGIANMDKNPDLEVGPSAAVTASSVAVIQTAAPAAAGCRVEFSGTDIEQPVKRLKNIQTGRYLDPAAGMRFVVVNTRASNSGDTACPATSANQRGYTSSTAFTTGSAVAGSQLYRGRRMTRSIGVGKAVEGAYVFQIPAGRTLTSVRLRSNGSDTWTTINAG
ncbi:MAG: hypothetical protein ABIS86_10650 [Streptosporangiaceae bacterium]